MDEDIKTSDLLSKIKNQKAKPTLVQNFKKKLIIVAVFIVSLVGVYCMGRIHEAESLAVLNNQMEEKAINPYETILREINEIGVLETVEVYYDELVEEQTADEGRFDISILSDKHYLVICSGVIHAGVDLTQAVVEEAPNKVVVNIPHATITSNEMDEDSIRYYDVSRSIFGKVDIEDIQAARVAIKEQSSRNATERGILGAAEENAREMLMSMYSPLMEETGFELEINYVDAQSTAETVE